MSWPVRLKFSLKDIVVILTIFGLVLALWRSTYESHQTLLVFDGSLSDHRDRIVQLKTQVDQLQLQVRMHNNRFVYSQAVSDVFWEQTPRERRLAFVRVLIVCARTFELPEWIQDVLLAWHYTFTP